MSNRRGKIITKPEDIPPPPFFARQNICPVNTSLVYMNPLPPERKCRGWADEEEKFHEPPTPSPLGDYVRVGAEESFHRASQLLGSDFR